MLYTMREGHDGIQFYPIRDYNVFIYCKQCKRFVQIPEPAGYIAEVGAIGVSIESLDLCDDKGLLETVPVHGGLYRVKIGVSTAGLALGAHAYSVMVAYVSQENKPSGVSP